MIDRAWLVLVVIGLLGVACAPPRPIDPATLDSPRAVAGVSWCESRDALGEIVSVEALDEGACPDGLAVEHRLLVANAEGRELHVIDIDRSEPYYVDLASGVPGENGITVAEGTHLVATLGHPALAAAASLDPPALRLLSPAYAIAVPFAGTVDGGFPLREAPSLLQLVRGNPFDRYATVVVDEPVAGALHLLQIGYGCVGTDTVIDASCTQRALARSYATLPLGGAVRSLAIANDGTGWATIAGSAQLLELGLHGRPLAEDCAGFPCVIARHGVGSPCRDGVDNDGDGLVDAEDPQCFDPNGDESGVVRRGALTACTNGIDDDGDGRIDADDDGCSSADDNDELPDSDGPTCADGVDNDLDGLIDSEDDDCGDDVSGEEGRALLLGEAPYPLDGPRCGNGLDDDGDGLADLDDPDCYAASSDREARVDSSDPTLLALVPPGDVLAIVDAVVPQVVFFDTETRTVIRPNDLDPWLTTIGAPLPSGIATAMVASTFAFDSQTADGLTSRITQRVVHVAATSGVVHTYSIDTAFSLLDAEGTEVGRALRENFRLWDQNPFGATVSGVDCSIPTSIADVYDGTSSIVCTDARLPQPIPRVGGEFVAGRVCSEAPPYIANYTAQPGDAYVQLPQEQTYTATEPERALGCPAPDADGNLVTQQEPPPPLVDGFYALDRPLDPWLRSDRIDFGWEGVLPGTDRQDGRLVDGWLIPMTGRPCEDDLDFCDALSAMALERTCPEARALCDAGVDVCEAVDPCVACPILCGGAADFCSSGVRPGDTVVFDRLPSGSTDCAAVFLRSDSPSTDPLREARVVEVAGNALRLAPIGGAEDEWPLPASADTGRSFIDRLPTDCGTEPLSFEVRAGGAFAVAGANELRFSPYEERHGECVLRGDAASRQDRVVLRAGESTTWEAPFGMRLALDAPQERFASLRSSETEQREVVVPRDFSIRYTLLDRYDVRSVEDGVFLLGPGTTAAGVVDSIRGPRVVFADDGQDIVWIYDATTFAEVTAPIP